MRFKFEEKKIQGETWLKFNSDYERWRYKYGNLVMAFFVLLLAVIFGAFLIYIFTYGDAIKQNPCKLCELSQNLTCIKFAYLEPSKAFLGLL